MLNDKLIKWKYLNRTSQNNIINLPTNFSEILVIGYVGGQIGTTIHLPRHLLELIGTNTTNKITSGWYSTAGCSFCINVNLIKIQVESCYMGGQTTNYLMYVYYR